MQIVHFGDRFVKLCVDSDGLPVHSGPGFPCKGRCLSRKRACAHAAHEYFDWDIPRQRQISAGSQWEQLYYAGDQSPTYLVSIPNELLPKYKSQGRQYRPRRFEQRPALDKEQRRQCRQCNQSV